MLRMAEMIRMQHRLEKTLAVRVGTEIYDLSLSS